MADRFRQLTDVGIFKDTLAPSLALHSSFSVAAWAVGRYIDRVETKDWLWPAGQVINAWWSAVGRHVVAGAPLSRVLGSLSRPEWLLLTGVSAWGLRLFYRVANRSIKRGKDDPRYVEIKKDRSFWNNALVKVFLPEAVFQAIVTLPITAPFRHQGGVLSGYHPYVQALSVGLFSTGFALQALADYQIDNHQASGSTGATRNGVWSIVRHPDYLGDTLVHAAFPLILYSSDMLAPIELLGLIANYVFLRYFGGDKDDDANQKERFSVGAQEKGADLVGSDSSEPPNAFWPNLKEASNQWTWVVLGCGVVGMGIEQLLVDILEY